MKILSIGMILGIGVLVSGCGLQVVKKENLQNGLDQVKSAVDKVQAEACSDTVKSQVQDVYTLIDGLIDKYGK